VRILALLSLAVVALLTLPTFAEARVVVRKDAEGRPISFDVRASNVDVGWYVRNMRRALHGDEISGVTIQIVAKRRIPVLCGRGAEACYKRTRDGSRVVVPAGRTNHVATLIFHEYGHHVDVSYGGVRGVPEMNGTVGWWAARRMDGRLANGRVAIGYSLGWYRSVGEIFAEDYARLHTTFDWQIRWIGRPSLAVRRAIRADIAAGPACWRCAP
jgi:hypothetical protein